MEPGKQPVVSPEAIRPLLVGGALGAAAQPRPVPRTVKPPQFLWPLEPRFKVFRQNLADLLLFRTVPKVQITARPGTFWSDVFVDERVSFRALADSFLVHIFLLVTIVGITRTYITYRPPELYDAFQHTRLTYYEVSEYLPEVHTTPLPKKAQRSKPVREGLPPAPADPVYAKQEIISVPPNPDNFRQTIVTPSQVRINRDIPLPNIVTAKPPSAADVTQIANRAIPKLETPPEIVAPKLKVDLAQPEIANASVPEAAQVMQVSNATAPKSLVPGEVDAPKLAIGMKMPEVATGAAPQAAKVTQIANGRRRRSAQPVEGEVAAPALKGSVAAPVLSATSRPPQAAPAPAAPSKTSDTGTGKTPESDQKILALSTNPAPASGTLNIPTGSRHGVFAAGPEGRPDATGAPETAPTSSSASSTNSSNGMPAGIHVSGGGDAAPHSGVVASGTPAHDPSAGDSLRNKMSAMLGSPSIPPPRVDAAQQDKNDNDPTAKTVFGDKRYYKLTVSMPNLASASGSWVIRFAELHPLAAQAAIPLSSPVPVRKSDPAYPSELIKDKVEGTVVLYAVIRADGTITDVKILNSINSRLDENAVAALKRWQFSPGSKAGQPVDVEAVVQVPFKVKRVIF